jgi:hypothetical protein
MLLAQRRGERPHVGAGRFRAGTVRLEPGTTKNREGRSFPFVAFPALAALLHRQWESTQEWQRVNGQVVPWVFWKEGRHLGDPRGACRRAGLPGRLVHDLRRSAARNLERAGVPRSSAMKLTGHLTESIYHRYAIVSEADLAEAVGKPSASAARWLHDQRPRSSGGQNKHGSSAIRLTGDGFQERRRHED